jgi:hypothetical protein
VRTRLLGGIAARAGGRAAAATHTQASTAARTVPSRGADVKPRRGAAMAVDASAALTALGYAFVPAGSGDKNDMVLRQAADTSKGFEWRGQQDYDAVGAAVVTWVRSQLTVLCGLEEVTAGVEPAVAYATPGWREHAGPFLLLVCGSAPGGTAGVWGRSLCINASTKEGARPPAD